MVTNDTAQPIAPALAPVKKERSPSFPFIGLPRAVERAKVVYAHAKRFEVRVGDVAVAWGWGSKSSGTLQTIAALVAYGLLEDHGSGDNRKLKISDLAFKILEDQRPGARESGLAQAALSPSIIAEMHKHWGHGRPADNICISELRFEKGFTDDGARAFLKVYDETIRFTDGSGSDKIASGKPEPDDSILIVKKGDYVQWTSGGVNQFIAPKRVVGVSDDEEWLWVEGSKTGIPMSEVQHFPQIQRSPPALPSGLEAEMEAAQAGTTKAGTQRDTFSLEEGVVTVEFPEFLTSESVGELEEFFALFIKKAKRRAAKSS